MRDRFRNRLYWRRFIGVSYVLIYLIYLSWRLTIINPESLFLSVSYFVAEFIGFILGLTAILTSWNYKHNEPKPPLKDADIDVVIPTYREPLHIIRRTLMAARDLDYPHRTSVFDDAGREDVKALATELGVQYFSRPENTDAKAGNLNFALEITSAEYLLVLDADHIILPEAIEQMLGFFEDENVGLVQTPQDYYNIDAFQYMHAGERSGLWHDQSFFYNIAQPCRDYSNGATCVGTGVIYRRTALNAIGGFPTQTVTEDIHTSLKMHKAGFKVVYMNEPVAYGVAASDLEEYYKTRHRWANGNLHALTEENILCCKGLSLKQKFSYLSLGLIYLEGWQQLLLFIIPFCALTFGLAPFEISIFNVLVVLLFPFLSYFMLQETGCGFTRFWANELFAMARWPIHIHATPGIFKSKIPWRSSAKNVKGRINWSLMTPQLSVMMFSTLALCIATYRLAGDFQTGPLVDVLLAPFSKETAPIELTTIFETLPDGYTLDLVLIAGFWAFYSIIRGCFFVNKAVVDAQNSHRFYRFKIPFPLTLDDQNYGVVKAISEEKIEFIAHTEIERGNYSVTITLPAGALDLSISVEDIKKGKGYFYYSGGIEWPDHAKRDQLANALYSVDWHREFLHRNAYFFTLSGFILGLFERTEDKTKKWRPVLYGREGELKMGLLGRNKGSKGTLIVFQELEDGCVHNFILIKDGAQKQVKYKVGKAIPLSSLLRKGLDGAVVRKYEADPVS